ncbi:MAG: winged helix-turn-helix domain-containing protein [Nanoarchaeota archaeon]|nr:winged helix-turn-helix domain-containing protein [Nanoarchaeota archaeon]
MAKEKFLLVSLKEEESKQLAQVISNPTARKILDALAEKEYTESDLAKELLVPISTVHYNLQALVKAKLVEAEEFHYSEKGKEVLHYKLANKYIIIAPKSTFGIREKLKSILPALGLVAAGTWAVSFMSGTGASRFSATLASAPAQIASAPAQEAGALMMKAAADTALPVATSNPIPAALWFLVGSVVTLVLLLGIEYVRYRKSR